MKTRCSCLFFGQRSTDRVIYCPSYPIEYPYKTLQFFPFSGFTSWRDGYFILKGLPNDIFPKEDLRRILFILYLKTAESRLFFSPSLTSVIYGGWRQTSSFTHETDSNAGARQMDRRAHVSRRWHGVCCLLSAGVLHGGGHVVGGLHIWRTSHPETSLPWKIWNRPNQQDFQGTWITIYSTSRRALAESEPVAVFLKLQHTVALSRMLWNQGDHRFRLWICSIIVGRLFHFSWNLISQWKFFIKEDINF